jgi:hypothetical protein
MVCFSEGDITAVRSFGDVPLNPALEHNWLSVLLPNVVLEPAGLTTEGIAQAGVCSEACQTNARPRASAPPERAKQSEGRSGQRTGRGHPGECAQIA